MVVIDEADLFFTDKRNFEDLKSLVDLELSKLKQKIQYILFSATYPEEIQDLIE